MFEIGKTYEITRDIDGQVITSCNCKVIGYDERNGLLKIKHGETMKIINLASPSFMEAKLQR